MKNLKNLMGLVMAAIVMSLGFVSCQKDDLSDHSNKDEGKAKLTITDEPKPNPGPQPVLRDSVWGKVIEDSLIIVHDSLRNDTIFKSETVSLGFSAKISREFDERKTTVERIKKLDFSFESASNSQNGKMQYVGSQKGNDMDAQNYTLDFTSEKLTKWGLSNVHFELVGTSTPEVKNTDIEKKATDSIRIKSEMTWPLTIKVVNVPNLEGKTFSSSMLNQTNHERCISYGAPVLVKRDTTMTPTYGVWSTEWLLKVVETYRVNGQDSVAPAQTKKVNLVSTCGIDKNEDAFVSSLEYSHNFTSEKWSNWYSVESADKNVSVQERRFERLGVGSNGIEKDKFNTRSFVTEQKATVVFAGITWNIPATDAKLTNVRHTFLEEASDIDGYSMIKFVDDEIATYAGATDGDNYKKLNSSCKLYLKLKEPEIIDYILVDGSDYKTRTENSVKVGLTIKPKYDDGTFGKEIPFKMERAESWTWKGDSVVFENVDFFMQETAEKMELVGDVTKTAKTQKDNGGVFSFNEYEGDFRAKVTSNGMTKYTTWHAIWSEDFSFTYTDENGKTFSHTFNKSDYNVKAQNASLKKNESKSSVTSEVYDYSVDGIFAIDNVNRSAKGYGRFQKAIEEVVIKEYWSEEKSAWTEYGINSYYKVKIIREYNTGKKTEQEFTYKHIGSKSGSSFELTAQSTEHVVGAPQENVSLKRDQNEKISDMVSFNYDLMKLDYKCQVNFDGAPEKTDIFHFEVLHGVSFSFVDVNGKTQVISFDDFNRSFTNNVKSLTVKSENESETQYNYINEGAFTYGGTTANVDCLGLIHVAKSTPVNPDFDIEVDKIYSTVSRPSNRNASDITAYTYLLVSKDGKKCLPIGIYNNVVTAGEITDMQAGFNSACYKLNENEVVATVCTLNNGIIKYKDANGKMIDGGMFIEWQSAGFNNRGNSYENWQHKHAPRAEKKNGVTVVTFEGTNVSYTFRGWNVQ